MGMYRQTAQYFTNCWGRNTFGRPYSLQGDFNLLADPGLKAWAMVSDRFAVKSDRHLGYHLSRLRRLHERPISQRALPNARC